MVKNKPVKFVYAEYLKTLKNAQVAQLYDSFGFEVIEKNEEVIKYKMEVDGYKSKEADYIGVKGGK